MISLLLKNVAFALRIFFAYAVLCVACFLMLRTLIGYTGFRDDAQFLAFKQAYIHNPAWKTAFYIHVFSAVIALLAGFTQFSTDFLRENPKLHRLIGKIYVVNILVINFPAGLIMGVYANGGLAGKTAFLLLDVLWFSFTLKAYTSVRNRRFVEHKNYMIRSYALTFSAITLRTWNLILSSGFEIGREDLYVIDAWLGFVPNLAIAELLIGWNRFVTPKRHRKNEDDKKSNERKTDEIDAKDPSFARSTNPPHHSANRLRDQVGPPTADKREAHKHEDARQHRGEVLD